ncbi:MAG: DEAD/DEAH box helicase [Planctomycetota bacterium]|jgi:ATP-dependent RNA helicase DeaD
MVELKSVAPQAKPAPAAVELKPATKPADSKPAPKAAPKSAPRAAAPKPAPKAARPKTAPKATETQAAATNDRPLPEKFAALGLSDEPLKALRDLGFDTPTPIQEKAIPPGLAGRDVVGQARTGTGKTAAFMLPALARTPAGGGTTTLVLAPTRELAIQVRQQTEELSRYLKVRTALIYGGVSFDRQRAALAQGVEIIVGTPGRVLDLFRQRTFDLSKIERVVLDECDRMFDLGFRPDIYRVLRATEPSRKQLLLFSATIDDHVLRIANQFMKDPEVIHTASGELTVDKVDQYYCSVAHQKKSDLIADLIKVEEEKGGLTQAIVFCRTKRGCDKLAKRLNKMGLPAQAIHGDLRQSQRERVLNDLRQKKVKLLIATDVAARGLDIPSISHVFNHDIPEYPEDYVHRVGRTARMGARGVAYTLVAPDQGPFLTQIEKLTNVLLEEYVHTDFDAGVVAHPEPKVKGTGTILYSSH